MAIKKFDDVPETPDVNTEHDEIAAVKASAFSPWLSDGDDSKPGLGKQAWSASGNKTEGKYEGDDLREAMLVKAQDAFETVEKVLRLYERASKNPTRENVAAYSTAVYALVENKEVAAPVISVLVATLFSFVGGSGRR